MLPTARRTGILVGTRADALIVVDRTTTRFGIARACA
jgi:hypothetical protein